MSRDLETAPAAVSTSSEALRRLLGRGSIYTLALAIQMLTALFVVPVVTRLLSPAEYGRVAAAIVVYAVLSILGGAGLPDAVLRGYFVSAQGPRMARRLVLATGLIALTLALVCEVTGPLWARAFGLDYGDGLRLAVWGAAAASVALCCQSLLRAADRAWAFLGVALIGTVGGQALALALTAILHSPTGYMAGLTAGTVLAAVAGLLITHAPRAGVASPSELKQALALGLPIVPHGLSVYLLISADRIVIAGVLGLAAAGRYQVAYAVGGLGVALIAALNQAWVPLILGAEESRRWQILGAMSGVVYLFAAATAVALALVAPLGLLIAAPASYGRAKLVPVCAVVAVAALPYAISGTYFQIVLVRGRTRVMALAAPLAAAVNVGLNLILLPVIGLTGAALATVGGYAVLPVVVALRARRMVRIPGVTVAAARAWLLATPPVVAGALLPVDGVGIWLRVAVLVLAAGAAYHLIRAALRAQARLGAPMEHARGATSASADAAIAAEAPVRAGS